MPYRYKRIYYVFVTTFFIVLFFLYTGVTVYETKCSLIFNQPQFYKDTAKMKKAEKIINFPRPISALVFDSSGNYFFTVMTNNLKVNKFSVKANDSIKEQVLRSDNGGVFEGGCFSSYLNTLIIADSYYDRLLILSSELNKPIEEIKVGDFPTRLESSKDGKRIFVLNYWEGTIMEIDLIYRKVIKTIKVGNYPKDFVLLKSEDFVYVTLEKDNVVAVIDLQKMLVIRKISVGNQPWGIFLDPSNDRIGYVANSHENSISKVDFVEGYEIERFPAGCYPTDIIVSRDGRFIFLANGMGGYISVIDTLNGKIVKEIKTGLFPTFLQLNDRDGFVYVVNSNDYYLSMFDSVVSEERRN
mgnify:CR=1 FL=1